MSNYKTLAEMAGGLSSRGTAAALIVYRDSGMEAWTYADLANNISLLAAGLIETGVQRGEPTLLCAPNSAEWVIAYFAIVCSGGLPVPLDDLSDQEVLGRVLADTGARRIFTSRSHLPALEVLNQETAIDMIVLDGAGDGKLVRDWRSLLAKSPRPLPGINPNDIASLLYTSGTTGTPKAVPLTHRNLLANVEALVAADLVRPEDRTLLPLPLHHSYPFTVGLLGTLASSGTLAIPAGISGPQITDGLKASRATILIGVPRLYTALLSAIENKAANLGKFAGLTFRFLFRLSMLLRRRLGIRIGKFVFERLHREIGPSLRILGCGGARLDPDVAWKLEAFGWEVLTGYGLTETSPIVTFNPRGRARIDSVGLPLPDVKLRIDAKPGQRFGEILVRGPNVFSGYRNNPDATKLAFTEDGWFRTGDLGFLDQEGYLHIIGRVKEIIVLPDGKNVYPEDVEDAYAFSPLIREVAILEQDGALAALVVPDEEAIRDRGSGRVQKLLRDEIEDLSLRLPPYQRVTGYRLTSETLPRTHLGKLQRHLLSDVYDTAERATTRPAAVEYSEEERCLLASEPAGRVWQWLVQRFPNEALTLDSNLQLDLRIDSLEWVTLGMEIQEHFGISLTAEAISRMVNLHDLLVEVRAAAVEKGDGGSVTDGWTLTSDELKWVRPCGPVLSLLGMLVLALNWLVMRAFFRLQVKSVGRFPGKGPYVIAPNHVSMLDPLVVAAAVPFRSLRHTYWAGWTGTMFAGPATRLLSRIARVFPVDPDRRPAAGIALGKVVLSRKQGLVWFPEGRRSPTGEIRTFLPGIGVLLQQPNVVVVPTYIHGTYEAMPRGRRLPRFRRIMVRIGEPMSADRLDAMGEGADKARRIADALQKEIVALQHRSP